MEAAPREVPPKRDPWRALALLSLLVAVSGFGLAGAYPIDNPDTYGHLAAGREIAALGRVPQVDTHSFWREAPQPWANYEWGSALLFWCVFSLGGSTGLLLLTCALLAGFGALLWARARDAGGDLVASLGAALAVALLPVARVRFTPRPHTFGLLLAALFLWALPRLCALGDGPEPRRAARRWIAGLALAHLAWVNLHGSNLLGLALVGLHLLCFARERTQRARLGALLGLQLLASCVSPYGPRILLDAVAHLARPEYRDLVSEWSPWSPRDPAAYLYALLGSTLLVALAAPASARARGVALASLASSTLLLVLGFRSLRFIADGVLFAAPVAALPLARALERAPLRARAALLPGLLAGAVAVAAYGATRLPPSRGLGLGENLRAQPVAAGRFLERFAPGARLFTRVDDAWYLAFASPRLRVLIDGRIPFYGVEHTLYTARAWQSTEAFEEALERFRVDAVVLRPTDPHHQHLLPWLRARPGWGLFVVEDGHCLFLRATPPREGLFAARALRAVEPTYDPEALLDPALNEEQLRRDLARLDELGGNEGYRAFARGLLALRPLARDGGRGGLRDAVTPEELARARFAVASLGYALASLVDLPQVVPVARAMAAVSACDRGAVASSLAAARREGGESRQTLLLAQEWARRQGDTAGPRSFVEWARRQGAEANDPWLAALEASLAAPPSRCP